MATLVTEAEKLSNLISKSELDFIKSLPKSIQNQEVSSPQLPDPSATPTQFNLKQIQDLVSDKSELEILSSKGISGPVNVIIRTDASEFIPGTNNNDVILALGGNDAIFGGDGHDCVLAGHGDDFVSGGSGNDSLFGMSGKDVLSGGLGDDFVSGGSGNDSLFGESGNDSLFGESGNDSLFGGSGNDSLSGGSGNDFLVGVDPNSNNPGINEIDTLIGGAGEDTLVAGDSNNPYYVGGGGTYGLNDYALIGQFESGTDTIQLHQGSNYIFGQNFIAITPGLSLDQGSIGSVEQIANNIAGGMSVADSLKLVPMRANLNIDIIAIVLPGYDRTQDLEFV